MALDELKALKAAKIINDFKSGKLRRRHIRYNLFRIRDGHPDYLENGLKELIEAQLDPNKGQTWDSFTFHWDVGANDPFKVIIKTQWAESGGGYDETGNRTPPAFTEQEK